MKRKQFVKQLMAVGISRNTATEAANAATRAELPLIKVAGRLLTVRGIFLWRLKESQDMRKEFDRAVLTQARMTPRRIRPLRSKKRRQRDGLRVDFSTIDELHMFGVDLAQGPDMSGLAPVRGGAAT
jgi:hypothetical protein